MSNITGAENYTVKAFMTRTLGLRGAELQTYALIYSFSHDGTGEFSGSRKYIAATIGCTTRTVTSALSKLTETGLIRRRRSIHNTSYIYSVDLEALNNENEKKLLEQNEKISSRKKFTSEMKKLPFRREEISTNNKENNKGITKTTTTTATERAQARGTKENTKDEKKSWLTADVESIRFQKNPWEKYGFGFFMTEEQFAHLDALVNNDEILLCYFGRLDEFMRSNPKAKVHSPYRTILKWIREDFAAETPCDKNAV